MSNSRGSATTEYALIAVVIVAAILFVASRYGGSVRGRYDDASDHVGKTSISRGLEEAALSEGASGSSASGGSSREVSQGAAAPSGVVREGKVRVGALEFDLQTVGVGILGMTGIIMIRLFKAAKPDPKKKNQQSTAR